MEIAIDFDGTCVTHEYPTIGKSIGAEEVLKELVAKGHKLILFTMRSGQGLEDAIKWFMVKDIPLYGVQYNPTQTSWTASNKCYAQLYIDDAALGCPLIYPSSPHSIEGVVAGRHYINTKRPYVDWFQVRKYLIENKIL